MTAEAIEELNGLKSSKKFYLSCNFVLFMTAKVNEMEIGVKTTTKEYKKHDIILFTIQCIALHILLSVLLVEPFLVCVCVC